MAGDFDSRYLALLEAIDECVSLLRAADESQFADWLESDRSKISDGKTRALQHLLSAYGGAGSINDILLEEPRSQKRLSQLRSEIWKQADAMLRELDEGGHYLNSR